MERNRVLWVIFSITLFLVVVLGVGLYLLRPVAEKGPATSAQAAPRTGGFDAFEYVRGRSELPPVEEPKEPDEMVIVVGEKPQVPAAGEAGGDTARPAAPPAAPPAAALRERPPAVAPAAPLPAAPAPAARSARAGASPERPRAPAAAAAPKTVTVREYWIQVASVSSLSRAEEVSRSLADQGLTAMVTTREMSGKTYYRVRLGPYPARGEAEKFLEWVRALKGYESSYISMVSARRPSP